VDVGDIGHEITAAMSRTGWIKVAPPPTGRYHLHGSVRDDSTGKLRIKMTLLDRSTNRYISADHSECAIGNVSGAQDWLSSLAVGALRSVLRDAEIMHARTRPSEHPTAWDLSMRALPSVLAADPSAHCTAIELLDRAMELAPHDPVPISLAA
jgi:hypothetical protein